METYLRPLGNLSLLKDKTINSLHGTNPVFKNQFGSVRRSHLTVSDIRGAVHLMAEAWKLLCLVQAMSAEMEARPWLSSPGFYPRTLAVNASTNRHTLPEDLRAVGI